MMLSQVCEYLSSLFHQAGSLFAYPKFHLLADDRNSFKFLVDSFQLNNRAISALFKIVMVYVESVILLIIAFGGVTVTGFY